MIRSMMRRLVPATLLIAVTFCALAFAAGITGSTSVAKAAGTAYAEKFSIKYLKNGCKIVTDSKGVKFLLVPRGQKRPYGYGGLRMVRTPVQRVICMSTTQLCLLRPIGSLGVVRGVSVSADDLYIAQVKAAMKKGLVKQVAGGMGEPDYEKVVALKPDVVFTYTESGPASEKMYQKFKELGLTTVVDNSWLESDPLARLEYVKMLAAFVNKDAKARAFFKASVARAKSVEKAARKASKKRPRVLWGMTMDGAKYWVNRGDSYATTAVKMAGGHEVFSNLEGVGSVQVSAEEVYARGRNADVWIFASMKQYFRGLNWLKSNSPLMAKTKPVKSNRVWIYQPWYYQVVDKTDEIIKDLAKIFNPRLFPGYKVKHFLKAPR